MTSDYLERAWAFFEQQAKDNYEVSKDIQLRDGVDRKGRKVKKK